MRRITGLLLSSLCCFAAEPNEKAHKLLDEAAATAGSTTLEVHILALMHLGKLYQVYDKPKAVDYFRQAFAATSSSGEDMKNILQGEIVKNLADVSLPEAAEQLRGMAEPATTLEGNTSAIDRVTQLLIAKSEFDKATEVMGLVPAAAAYPFRAAGSVFDALPNNDPRRVLIFTRATAAYQRRPEREFTEMLHARWRKLPREVAEAALNAVANAILVKKDQNFSFNGDEADDNGKMILKNLRTVELAWMYQVMNGVDPKRAQELAATNQEIKTASVEKLKEPKTEEKKAEPSKDDEDDGMYPPLSILRGIDIDNLSDRIGQWALAEKKATAALELAEKDLPQSLSRIGDLPYPAMKAQAICGLAKKFAPKDQATGKSLIDKCLDAVSDVKDPADTGTPLLSAAQAAMTIKLRDRAWEAMQKAVVISGEAYVAEANAEKVNKALREYWPSLQMCRLTAYTGAKLFAEEADTLLRDVRDPDMSVIMRIEMARALMKEPQYAHSMSFRF